MVTATPATELRPGLTVSIHSLTGAAELNGQVATCKQFDAEKSRWTVQLTGGELKALRPENLQPKKTNVMLGVSGALGAVLLALFLQQSGFVGKMGIASTSGYMKELFEPFDPPPPKAPKDTVVISFCQG